MNAKPRVLIVVFDGLRPDLVTPERMPVLAKFVEAGCRFANSRCVFPSATRVNSAALGAGSYPDVTGLVGNLFYDPAVYSDRAIHTGKREHIEKAEAAYGGRFVDGETLGDVLAANGLEFVVVGSGSAGTTRLVNPRAKANGQVSLCMRDWSVSTPIDLANSIIERFGPIAEIGHPSTARMEQHTTMFIEGVFPARKPDVSLLWFNEPDWTQHYKGLGSPEANAALTTLDRQFQRLLDWSQSDAVDGPLEIVVLSDHGHITANSKIDLARTFDLAGFEFRPEAEGPRPFVAHLGNTGAVWMSANESPAKLIEWLNKQPWCGLIFAKDSDELTFDRALLNNGHQRSPDLFFTLRSDGAQNSTGIAGSGLSGAQDIPIGGSFHGGPSHWEMNNLLALGGPGFCQSMVYDYPAGIVDVTPTVLAMVGIEAPARMSGRVLREAFRNAPAPSQEPNIREIRRGNKVARVAEFGGTRYFLDGEIEE